MAEIRRLGFTLLAKEEDSARREGPSVTIIFVHGLRGGPKSTWTVPVERHSSNTSGFGLGKMLSVLRFEQVAPKVETKSEDPREAGDLPIFWPQEFLPQSVPNATIWTYGYDADVIGDFFASDGRSQNTISQHGQDLMLKLGFEISGENPIIFIAHSLGGIIVKDALCRAKSSDREIFTSIHKRTHCVIFLGTPHRGSGTAEFGRALANIAAVSLKDSNVNLLRSLNVDSEVLSNIHAEFMKMLHTKDLFVHSFQEGHGYTGWKGINGKVVSDFSSMFDDHPQQLVATIGANHIHMTKFACREDEGYRQVLQAVRYYISLIQQSARPLGSLSYTSPAGHFVVPYSENPEFVIRASYIKQLESRIHRKQQHSRLALVGFGGIGKSQIALHYAYKLKRKSTRTSIFWVRGSDSAKFKDDYRKIATIFNLPESKDPSSNILQVVETWLSGKDCGSWIMIIDNADNSDLFFSVDKKCSAVDGGALQEKPLFAYIPQSSNGSIIFTTNDRRAGIRLTGNQLLITVGKMNDSEELELAKSKLGIGNTEIEDMAKFLDEMAHLPLAIVQAAAFIRENSMTISDYLRIYHHSDINKYELLSREFIDLGRDGELPNAVMMNVIVSLNRMKEKDPQAAALVSLTSFLDWQNIPRSLIYSENESLLEFEEALGTLKRLSFITAHHGNRFFEMHRFVHLATRKWVMGHSEERMWAKEALQLMSERFPRGEQEDWRTCAEYSQHAEAVLKLSLSHQTDDKTNALHRANLLYHLSWFFWYQGEFSTAREHADEAYELRRQFIGMESAQILDSISILATISRSQGNYAEAEQMSRQDLAMCERILGKSNQRTMISLGNFASLLLKLGKYHEAEERCRQALTVYEQSVRKEEVRKEDPSMLSTISILASALTSQEKYDEAETCSQRALLLCEEVHGKRHRHTVTTMATLATVFLRRKRYSEAEQLSREVVEISTLEFGEDHPDTLSSMINLTAVLRHQEKYGEAEEWCQQALKGLEGKLGPKHPHTLTCVFNLALIFQGRKDYEESEALCWRTLKGRVEILGKDHPATLNCLRRLLDVLRDQGKCGEAEETKRQFEEGKMIQEEREGKPGISTI